MAYIQNNSPQSQEDKITPNVLGGGQTQPETEQNQQLNPPQSAPIIQTQQQVVPTSQPAQQAPSKQASSGIFTNVRKYIQANTGGGGEKIGQAVVKDTGRQAQQIGQQIQQQQNKYQSQIAQQQQMRDTAGQQAQQTIQQAMTSGKIQPQSLNDFRQLATGNRTFEDVGKFDTQPSEYQAEVLKQKQEGLKNFENRSGTLQDIFSKQREYSRGQSSLDNLIFGGSPALQQTQQQTGQIVGQAQGVIDSGKREATDKLGQLISENRQFSEGLQGQVTQGRQGTLSEIDKTVQQAIADRQKLYNQQVGGTLSDLQRRINKEKEQISQKAVIDRLLSDDKNDVFTNRVLLGVADSLGLKKQMVNRKTGEVYNEGDLLPGTRSQMQMRGELSDPFYSKEQLNQVKNKIQKGEADLNKVSIYGDASGFDPFIKRVLGVDEDRVKLLGIDPAQFNTFYKDMGSKNPLFYGSDPGLNIGQMVALADKIAAQADSSSSSYAQNILKDLGINQNLQDIAKGKDLTRATAASQDQLARYNALSQLAGLGSDIKQTGAQRLSNSQIKELAKRLGKV